MSSKSENTTPMSTPCSTPIKITPANVSRAQYEFRARHQAGGVQLARRDNVP